MILDRDVERICRWILTRSMTGLPPDDIRDLALDIIMGVQKKKIGKYLLSEADYNAVMLYVKDRKKIEAIKLLRECISPTPDLKDALDAINTIY